MTYIVVSENEIVKAEMERPVFPSSDDVVDENIDGTFKERLMDHLPLMENYEAHLASLPRIPIEGKHKWKLWSDVELDKDFRMEVKCPDCGGDGKETCHNPDHGFIDAVGGELRRLGCPVCGHDEDHKVNRGRNVCPECGGLKTVTPDVFEEYGREYGYDKEPEYIAIPIQPTSYTKAMQELKNSPLGEAWDNIICVCRGLIRDNPCDCNCKEFHDETLPNERHPNK